MSHAQTEGRANRDRLAIVFGLVSGLVLVETSVGIAANSLALLADAGHLFADAVGIGIALVAIWLAGRPPSPGRTFGYARAEILAAVVNAGLLFAVAMVVLLEAWRRAAGPPEVSSGALIVVGLLAIVVNGMAAWLLRSGQATSLNVRGAYLEVLGDLFGAVAVVVAGVVIAATGLVGADIVAAVVVAVLILPRTWGLLREAVDVLLEATPKGIDLTLVRRHIVEVAGVMDVHDLHAWTITSGLPVVSAHVIVEPGADPAAVLDELCRCLSGDFDVDHSTFQLESADRRRLEVVSHS